MTRPAITTATAGFPGSAAWWKAQVYDPINWLYGMQPLVAYKTADTSVTSNTTVAADPHLSVTAVANTNYRLEGFLLLTSAAAAAGSLKMDINGPSGISGYWSAVGPGGSSTADPDSVRTIATTIPGTTRSYGVSTAGGVYGLPVTGFVSLAATAGSVFIEWAQLTSSATAVTLKAGSWMSLSPIG